MDPNITLFVLMVGLTLAQAYHHYDYNDDYGNYEDDYDYRPSPSRHHGRKHFGRYPSGPFPQRPRRLKYYALSFGGKGNYKLSGSGNADGNLLGQKGGFKGASAQEGYGEAGGKWDGKSIGVGGKGASRGSSTGAIMGDTWVGGGSSKLAGAHDIGGETGVSWDNGDNDPGMDKKGYLGNFNEEKGEE